MIYTKHFDKPGPRYRIIIMLPLSGPVQDVSIVLCNLHPVAPPSQEGLFPAAPALPVWGLFEAMTHCKILQVPSITSLSPPLCVTRGFLLGGRSFS